MKDDIQQIHTPIYLKAPSKCGKIIDIAAGGSYCLILNGKMTTIGSYMANVSILLLIFDHNRKSRSVCLGLRNSRCGSKSRLYNRTNAHTNDTVRTK